MTSTGTLIKPFYPALDGLRAVAILMVFAVHYGRFVGDPTLFKWGFVGVDLFFVLSGFLITGILYDTLHKPHFFRNFYIRRSLRIFPLFYGFWILLIILTPIVHPFLHIDWNRYLLTGITYTGNFFVGGAERGLHPSPFDIPFTTTAHPQLRYIDLNHLWSLCVEEQFYMVWPFVVWFVHTRRLLLRLCLAIAVFAPFFRWFLYLYLPHDIIQNTSFLYDSTITRVDTLLIGAAIALWLRGPSPSLHTIREIYWILCIVPPLALIFCLLSPLNLWQMDYRNPILNTVGFTLIALTAAGILLAAIDTPSGISQVLSNRHLVSIGRLSYGIYFIHQMPLQALGGRSTERILHHRMYLVPFIAFAVIYAAAWLSFRYFESPFLRLKDRIAPQRGHVSDPPPATLAQHHAADL